MEIIVGIVTLIVSGAFLYFSSELIVGAALLLSRYFRVTEFAVSFFVMAFAASLPDLFIGVTSALQGVPELSFGDIMGSNVVVLTIAVAFGVLFSAKKEVPIEGQTVQDTTFLTAIAAILPLILVSDGMISRSDGLVLILFFAAYVFWMFSKKEHFSRVYEDRELLPSKNEVKYSIIRLVFGVVALALSAQGIVHGAKTLALHFGLPIILVGILVIGLGGALPEIYFTIISARKGVTGLIIGNLMGSVIIPATFVLGVVAVIQPIHNPEAEFSAVARVFLVIVSIFFLFISRSKKVVTTKDAVTLIIIYLLFVCSLVLFFDNTQEVML